MFVLRCGIYNFFTDFTVVIPSLTFYVGFITPASYFVFAQQFLWLFDFFFCCLICLFMIMNEKNRNYF